MIINAHMKTPKTKLDMAAESMDDEIISILSGRLLASFGCVTKPSMKENNPAMDPAIKA
jgi:hypothetical protein